MQTTNFGFTAADRRINDWVTTEMDMHQQDQQRDQRYNNIQDQQQDHQPFYLQQHQPHAPLWG